jgi:hypothetical protein
MLPIHSNSLLCHRATDSEQMEQDADWSPEALRDNGVDAEVGPTRVRVAG